jgi:signal transduction histidine kinase
LVWPLYRLAKRIADRVVFRGRATPYEVLTSFAGRLGETYANDDVLPRMARVLADGTGATSATVWLGNHGSMRLAASWPDRDASATIPEDAVEVRHQGEVLGALSVDLPPSDPMNTAKASIIEAFASQAGLVLRNVALIEDLKASRQRLVAAQDEERRKIERNIHDGAQQQLVALAVQLKLAEQMVDRDATKAKALLEQMQGAVGSALEDLRDLARGIYPPLLADKGLAPALEAQARKAAVPTSVTAADLGRYGADVEATVYFACLEALNNVAKYAQASRATIGLAQDDGRLTFEVSDDGRGFDPAATGYGTGLQGIADRLAAIGGNIEVTSAPGDGTRIMGSIPLRSV